jgi:hypothetical protein
MCAGTPTLLLLLLLLLLVQVLSWLHQWAAWHEALLQAHPRHVERWRLEGAEKPTEVTPLVPHTGR